MVNNLYNRNLQTTIILFTRIVSSHKTDWILPESPCFALSCLLYRMVSSLMNTLEGECFCHREISINVNKLLVVLLSLVLFIRYFFYCSLLLPVYILISFFILKLLPLIYFFISFFYTNVCCYIFVYSLIM